ncbi:MAG: DUF2391 domain-containing protein [Haloarculaceae archaeon]
MSAPADRIPEDVDVDHLLDSLETLESTVDDEDERRQVRRSIRLARRLDGDGVFGQAIRKYTREDLAESFVGSVVFAIPMLVESGVFDIARTFETTTVVGVPVLYLANAAFVVTLTTGVLYWAEFQNVEVYRPLFGVVPRRLVGVLVVSFLASVIMMTLWGRVGGWADPWDALARVSVVWSVAAIGAGLGDILPGESDAADLNDDIGDLVDALR